MNTRHIVAAAALALLGSSAFAGGEFDPMTGFNLQQAPAAAKAAPKAAARTPSTAVASGLSRDDVKAEFLKSRAEGSIPNFDVGNEYAKAPTTGVGIDREVVRAEARASIRGGKTGS
jgi:hypothetical protein